MQYGRLSHEALTALDEKDGYGTRKYSNAESINRVYYDYHGKRSDEWEMEGISLCV